MKHVITMMVQNEPGVLARIVGLISGRGFNIDSLNVAPTQDPDVSRVTLQVPGDDRVLEQVTKQLNKLVDVIKVSDLTTERFVDRELVLVKVGVAPSKRKELQELVAMLNAKVALVQEQSLLVEMVGNKEQVADFIELMRPHKILDVSRTGVIAVAR